VPAGVRGCGQVQGIEVPEAELTQPQPEALEKDGPVGVEELGVVTDPAEPPEHLEQPTVQRGLGGSSHPVCRRPVGLGHGSADQDGQPMGQQGAGPRRGRDLQLGRGDVAVRDGVDGRRGAAGVAPHQAVYGLGGEGVGQRVDGAHQLVEPALQRGPPCGVGACNAIDMGAGARDAAGER
jgi:hypothetical protein